MVQFSSGWFALLVWLLATTQENFGTVQAFVSRTNLLSQQQRHETKRAPPRLNQKPPTLAQDEDNCSDSYSDSATSSSLQSRRHLLGTAASTTIAATALLSLQTQSARALDDTTLKQAIRPTAFRVDSTTPPTLLPLNAAKERRILSKLGQGSGTDKEAILVDTLNFNNMLNKAVYGTMDAVKDVTGARDTNGGDPGSPTFCLLGVPSEPTSQDVDFAISMLDSMTAVRKSPEDPTGLGLAILPYSTQNVLDDYTKGSVSTEDLVTALTSAGVPAETVSLHLPLLEWTKSKQIDVVALSPEAQDLKVAASEGLQGVNLDRRADYVIDTTGFIALSQDPKFKLYTERSLLKDYEPNKATSPGFFYAQRILAHEAAATALARYATRRPNAFCAVVAPTPDVRFLGGINGRLPRLCQALGVNISQKAVTTILLNPTAEETLSASRYLRLEIGTGPETLENQTKVADYLWFSSIPKVNLLPRIME